MRNDPFLFSIFSLCSEKKAFVYEHIPGLFGDSLSMVEVEHWQVYNIMKAARHYDVDYSQLTFDETVDAIDSAAEKFKRDTQIKK